MSFLVESEKVYHRRDAVWPMTVVGRPPQEDTVFGELIHELTGPVIPTVLPGVRAVHAVDAAGVHPLLLAIGSERYTPYAKPVDHKSCSLRPLQFLVKDNCRWPSTCGSRKHHAATTGAWHSTYMTCKPSSLTCSHAWTGRAICTFIRAQRSTHSTTAAKV